MILLISSTLNRLLQKTFFRFSRKLTLANEFSVENSRVHLFAIRIGSEFWRRQNSVSKPKVCDENGVNILGTSIDSIDIAEDRDLFRHMMEKLEIPMPESGMAIDFNEAKACADKIGYPIMMR